MRRQPLDHLISTFVGGKDWVEDLFDFSSLSNHGQSLEQPHSGDRESGKAQGIAQSEFRIAQNFKWQVVSFCHFALIFRRLSTHAVHGDSGLR